MNAARIYYFAILLVTIVLFSQCTKDEFNTDPNFNLEFSADTVLFDTVFTSIGSVTKSLVIRNTSNNRINISDISLARGKSSPFRLNIDGTAAENYSDLEIAAHDSAYIFVKVTIDPKNENNPLIESDSIVFNTNGRIQDVKLVAWGQDAYFYTDTIFSGNVTLPDNKPHVFYGKLIAGNSCNMVINEGTRIYFHKGSSMEVRKDASLTVNGTIDKPVVFTSDRLDDDYLTIPGLWEGIWLENGCKNISFTYAEITNARVGIQADSCGFADNEPLRLHNCMINNMSNFGIRATKARITATNCQITNCGGNVVSVEQGGSYDFRNCTLACYSNGKGYPCLSLSNYSVDTNGKQIPGDLTEAYFGNCIITGSQQEEIVFYERTGTPFNFQFDQCLVTWVKQKYAGKGYEAKFTNCVENKSAKFVDPVNNNFQLDTLSFAKDVASVNIINTSTKDITLDRKSISRLIPGPPDMGAYERVEKSK